MKTHENIWESNKISILYESLWKSMSFQENSWTSMGYIRLDKRKEGYIQYSKNIDASHMCPPEKNKSFKQRTWKSRFSGNMDFDM